MIKEGSPRHFLRAFASDPSGATSIEYALVAAGIAGVVIATINSIGLSVVAVFFDDITSLF